MNRKLLGFFSFGGLIGLTGLMACTITTAGDKYPSADSFCQGKAEAECKDVADLCGTTSDNCVAKVKPVCMSDAADAAGQGRIYTASLAQDCIDKTSALYAAARTDPTAEAAQQDNCARVFAGTVDLSQPCTTSLQCKGTRICDKGVCADPVQTAADQGCNNPGDVCVTGYYCGLRGQLNFCNSKKASGEICSPTSPCQETLRCVGDATGGTCAALLPAGGACTADTDCLSGLSCQTSGTNKVCAAKSFALGSQSCKDVGGS